MGQPTLTHESRCLIIVAGNTLERCIEDRAQTIAANRSADTIAPEDVEKATADFFREEIADLPRLVRESMDKYRHHFSKAA
jgi:hypothetical protein